MPGAIASPHTLDPIARHVRTSPLKSIEDIRILERVHGKAPIDLHAGILFGGLQLAGMPFLDLYRNCLARTGTSVKGWKVFRRAQRAYCMGRYLEYAARLPGCKIECGVFGGFSALMSCRILGQLLPGFNGDGLYLCDSFEGLSAPCAEDLVEMNDLAGPGVGAPGKKLFAVDYATVATRFSEFLGIRLVKGWIPDVFGQLPDAEWSYVHVDVGLYEPTLACLEYFQPRMVKGGVILNDDYGSPMFPGGGRSWREFFDARGLSYAVLDTGQSIYIKDR